MNAHSSPGIIVRSNEILNFFGKCPACGYPARASDARGVRTVSPLRATVSATCELPCGWSGQLPLTIMT
ncbi:hypothetical protein [Nocardia noduli]|uniref:hypothetical protein n=1 Tax=Nocardia noduli TaxID=2815722 RepID=UPI001C22E5BD|nr:hypothetical protein [Nocardia noduli]